MNQAEEYMRYHRCVAPLYGSMFFSKNFINHNS